MKLRSISSLSYSDSSPLLCQVESASYLEVSLSLSPLSLQKLSTRTSVQEFVPRASQVVLPWHYLLYCNALKSVKQRPNRKIPQPRFFILWNYEINKPLSIIKHSDILIAIENEYRMDHIFVLGTHLFSLSWACKSWSLSVSGLPMLANIVFHYSWITLESLGGD